MTPDRRATAEAPDRCPGCGLEGPDGAAKCRALFERLIARDFGEPPYFAAAHRMLVDTYALQHPERYCVSARSLAAHLCGLCQILERDASPASGDPGLQRWLDGRVDLEKPSLPDQRGRLTVADVIDADTPAAHAAAVRRWAEATWLAYEPLHEVARTWAELTEARKDRRA